MKWWVLIWVFLFTSYSQANCTFEMNVEGVIGTGVLDYIQQTQMRAQKQSCESIFLKINTPGGSLESTRKIVEVMLNSEIPYLCLVYPSGAHAGSAGAIILQACHVSGAMVATNIGAATPIQGTGKDMADDLRKKIINDTISWLEGITKLRGRNLKFSRDIITEAKAVDAKTAQKLGAIDFVVQNEQEFLEKAKGRKVKVLEEKEIEVRVGEIKTFDPGVRYHFLQLVSDPQIAYLIFMGSLSLLYFEITHPGTLVPGVLGALGLVVSLISFHKLNVWWGGLSLIILGMIFMIAEAFVPSFGILGLGGIVAFVLGSIFLFDAETSGMTLSLATILPTALGLGLLMLGLAYLAYQTRNVRRKVGQEEMLGKVGVVRTVRGNKGQIEVLGEIWNFKTTDELSVGDEVQVTEVNGLKLTVKKGSVS